MGHAWGIRKSAGRTGESGEQAPASHLGLATAFPPIKVMQKPL